MAGAAVENLDLNFFDPTLEAEAPVTPETPPAKPDSPEPSLPQDVLDSISEIIMPQNEPAEAEAEAEAKPAAKKDASPAPKPKPNPIIHNNELLRLAGSWGIGPDEAARYPTEDALLGQVAIRELRYRNEVERRTRAADPQKPPADELKAPEFTIADDVDPSIKKALESVNQYAKQLQDRAEREISAMRETVEALRSEHDQAAQRDIRATEAKVESLFDEKVASWGEEFQELIGTPRETWRQPGTPQHAELTKLRNYVLERKIGYEMVNERQATPDQIAVFLEEARSALWPTIAQKTARREVANGLRKQKGGVGLPAGRSRNGSEPVPQGREAGVQALEELMGSWGHGSWGRRSA